MKVLFLIQGFEQPASRYRVLQYLDSLRASGVEERLAVFPKGRGQWRALARDIAECDVVFVQKKRLKRRHAAFIRRSGGAKIIYDVDDAVMFKSSRAKSHVSRKRMSAFAGMCGLSDFVITGNGYLEAMAREHNRNTAVIPTSINMALYPPREEYGTDTITIGWIGGRKSLVFLKALTPVFEELYDRRKNTRLKIVCNEFFNPPRMPVVKKQWRRAEEGADVAGFDIGLAPLPDDPWSRGKCATKLLQCMAAGVPCVAAAVGVHGEIVRHGENGFLAAAREQWLSALERLCSDEKLRSEMGGAARETVRVGYSLEASVPKMQAVFKRVLD